MLNEILIQHSTFNIQHNKLVHCSQDGNLHIEGSALPLYCMEPYLSLGLLDDGLAHSQAQTGSGRLGSKIRREYPGLRFLGDTFPIIAHLNSNRAAIHFLADTDDPLLPVMACLKRIL